MDWLSKEPEYNNNYSIISNIEGEYQGILSAYMLPVVFAQNNGLNSILSYQNIIPGYKQSIDDQQRNARIFQKEGA